MFMKCAEPPYKVESRSAEKMVMRNPNLLCSSTRIPGDVGNTRMLWETLQEYNSPILRVGACCWES